MYSLLTVHLLHNNCLPLETGERKQSRVMCSRNVVERKKCGAPFPQLSYLLSSDIILIYF